MALLGDLIIYTSITTASKIYKSVKGIIEVQCPYCYREHCLEDGYYICYCGNSFRKVNQNTYKKDDSPLPLYEYVAVLFNLISKSNGSLNSDVNLYIKDILSNELELNKEQIYWIYNSPDSTINCNDYNIILNKIKKSSDIFQDPKQFCISLLKEVLIIFNLSKSNLEYSDKLIKSFMNTFNIGLEDYIKCKSDLERLYNNKALQDYKSQVGQYYEILGISSNANKNEIKTAYKKKVKLYHPDRYNSYNLPEELKRDINEKMKEINLAYEYLIRL